MVSVQAIKSAFAKHRFLLIAAILVPNVIAILVAVLSAKAYEASAWILIGGNRASQPAQTTDEQKAGPDQVLRTQISIALSEEVIRQAIRRFKPEDLLAPGSVGTGPAESVEDAVYSQIRNGISAAVEPNTFVVKFSFRHQNPKIAADFTNKLVSAFLSRRAEIMSNPGAAEFFNTQESHYNRDLAKAADALEEFSTKTGTYAIEEQKRLTLSRRDTLLSALGTTRGSVKRAESQSESLRYQISMLKTRITLPPEIFGTTNFSPEAKSKPNDALWADPPLLHIKLYQQMAEKLVESNAELSGLHALEAQQRRDLAAIDGQLQTLASRETEFQRLQRDVTRASSYIESFRRKSQEAQMDNAWLRNEAFSTVQIIQNATVPLDPSSPKVKLILALGFSVGLLSAAALVYVLMARTAPGTGQGTVAEPQSPREQNNLPIALKRLQDESGAGGVHPHDVRSWPVHPTRAQPANT